MNFEVKHLRNIIRSLEWLYIQHKPKQQPIKEISEFATLTHLCRKRNCLKFFLRRAKENFVCVHETLWTKYFLLFYYSRVAKKSVSNFVSSSLLMTNRCSTSERTIFVTYLSYLTPLFFSVHQCFCEFQTMDDWRKTKRIFLEHQRGAHGIFINLCKRMIANFWFWESATKMNFVSARRFNVIIFFIFFSMPSVLSPTSAAEMKADSTRVNSNC